MLTAPKVLERLEAIGENKNKRFADKKLERIWAFLDWLESQGIMTDDEMEEKEEVIETYLSYHQGIALPKAYSHVGDIKDLENQPELKAEIEKAVSEPLDAFIKEMTSKYAGSGNRKHFRLGTALEGASMAARILQTYNGIGVLVHNVERIKTQKGKELVRDAKAVEAKAQSFIKAHKGSVDAGVTNVIQAVRDSKDITPAQKKELAQLDKMRDALKAKLLDVHKQLKKLRFER